MDTARISLLVSYIVTLMFWGKVYAQTDKPFSVIDYGAVGDGTTDDSQAFAKAWNATCVAKSTSVTLQIPKGKTFMSKQLKFQGPCKASNINIQVAGKIVAPSAISDYPQRMPNSWLQVSNVDGLTINGGGEFNGRGQAWWNTCKGRVCKPGRPAMAIFDRCNNFRLQNLGFFNSSRIHILNKSCTNVQISKLHVQSPGDTINTDGIDIAASNEVSIEDSVIGGGDDCVAITNESRNISITGVTCGPSHGISIGSLGEGGKSDTVEGIYVSNCTIQDSSNGARIKSYQGGAGYARNMIFKDIVLVNTSNPIFLDQYYCPERDCVNKTTTLKISDVSFRNIRGTTPSDTAILLHCSQETGCTNIDLDEITITSSIPVKQTHADCLNAHGRKGSSIIPSLTCLKPVV